MGRKTAGGARVVPTADATACARPSSSAVVFTPVLNGVFPVDHVADGPESGATSSACYREDGGQQYVSHLPSSMRSIVRSGILRFVCKDGRGSSGQYLAWNRGAGSGATERKCYGESRRIRGYITLHAL